MNFTVTNGGQSSMGPWDSLKQTNTCMMTSYQSVRFKVDQVHPYTTKAPIASAVKHHLHQPSALHPPKKTDHPSCTTHPGSIPSHIHPRKPCQPTRNAECETCGCFSEPPTYHQPTKNIGIFYFFPKKTRVSVWCLVNFQDLDDRPIFRDFDRSASRMSRFSTKSRTLTTWSTRENAVGSTAVAAEVGIF